MNQEKIEITFDELYIEWTEEMTTGLAWQDFQHAKFINHIGKLIQTLLEQVAPLDLNKEITYLEDYADEHFGIEERYMELTQYADRESHIKQHTKFRDMLEAIKQSPHSPLVESTRLCGELNKWFVNHIKTVDMKLSKFIKEQEQR
ncbi:MAG: hemerythrin family protein [Deltaproteobacteria bacterium]|nr:hemerythrin family protein [Deltaproteobacteria bacterium]